MNFEQYGRIEYVSHPLYEPVGKTVGEMWLLWRKLMERMCEDNFLILSFPELLGITLYLIDVFSH